MTETGYNRCAFCGQTFGNHENSCPLNLEEANPEVYRPEDGHPFKESPWPSLKDRCDLCGVVEGFHVS